MRSDALKELRGKILRARQEMDDMLDWLDVVASREKNRGKPGRPIEDVMRQRGLLPKKALNGRVQASGKAST